MDCIDTTEQLRRIRLSELNSEQADRRTLKQRHGRVWDARELSREFHVIGFMAPFVIARRKTDNIRGSLEFQACPRFYFNWRQDPVQGDSQWMKSNVERDQR